MPVDKNNTFLVTLGKIVVYFFFSEQKGIIQDQKLQLQQLQDEAKNLREQLQQQDDWGDDDYYSEDDNGWESWSADSNRSRSNASNDNDSMVGFSENSEPYDPWSPDIPDTFNLRHTSTRIDVVYRVTPPASPTESDQRGSLPNDSATPASPLYQPNSTAAAASDHTYYSYDDDLHSDASRYSGDDNDGSYYSNYGSADDNRSDESKSQDDQNSQAGSFSWRSGSSTPIGSGGQGSFASWSRSGSRSSSVLSENDRNTYSQSGSNSDSESNSSGGRVPNHGKFSHVNTSSSSDSDSESVHDTKAANSAEKLPSLCVSDDQVTSSGLVEYATEESTSNCMKEKQLTRKRKLASSDSDDDARQGSSKKMKRSDNFDQSASGRSGESSGSNHRDSTSDNCSTPSVRRSPRRPKPAKNTNSLPLYSSDSSESDTSYKIPTEIPSDVTISDEHMTDEFSGSEHERFETVDKLLDRYCEESDSNDGSWSPSN
jgi:hypothetical protein